MVLLQILLHDTYSDTLESRTFSTSPPSDPLQQNFLLFAIGSTTVSCIERLNPSDLPTELYISLVVVRPFIQRQQQCY